MYVQKNPHHDQWHSSKEKQCQTLPPQILLAKLHHRCSRFFDVSSRLFSKVFWSAVMINFGLEPVQEPIIQGVQVWRSRRLFSSASMADDSFFRKCFVQITANVSRKVRRGTVLHEDCSYARWCRSALFARRSQLSARKFFLKNESSDGDAIENSRRDLQTWTPLNFGSWTGSRPKFIMTADYKPFENNREQTSKIVNICDAILKEEF